MADSADTPVGTPTVAVVVATYRRRELLPDLIAAIFEQDYAGSYEVVIVDDCSGDGTWDALQDLRGTYGPRLKIHLQPRNGGAAAARNIGWQATDAPLIAFTDDDCRPVKGWLRSLVEAAGDADFVQGCTLADPEDDDKRGPFSHTIEITSPNDHFETCNIVYRREVLERLGGFDERFPSAFGEDTDLGWRAREAGYRAGFSPDAVVYHQITASDWWRYMRFRRRRATFVLLCKKHPGLRKELTLNLFSNPSALAIPLAVTIGIVGGRLRAVGWLLALALSVRYVVKTVQAASPPPTRVGWLTVVPLHFVADLSDLWTTARASVRYRTPVL